ncbi:hypothetical protein EC991_005262 [Linnemannia zychae]|nr:hypothetical protein EC991_005262 [Linnemannia zychae]
MGSGNQGIGVVTDTNTGYIYITGGYSDVTVTNIEKYHPDRPGVVAKIPFPTVTGFVARWYAGNVFCKTRGSILYFGGYNGASQLDPDANIVTEFNVTTSQFSTLPTKGPRPAMRADHCMSISEDSTRIVVYGGRLNNGVTGTIHILDLNTLVWTAGEMGEARSYPSCVLSGDNVVVWGGKNAAPQPGAPEPIVKIPLLIYSISRNAWVDTYYPPGTPISVGPSGTGSTPPPTTTGGANSKSSNTGAVVGGVISGLAAICAVVGLLWWRRRKHQRGGGDMKRPFLVKPSTAHTPGSDPDENKALGSGDYTSNTTTMTAAAGVGYDTPSKNHKSPQAVVESNPDLEWTLRDIENQQMQLDLKRQLLALQQQEQHLRGPLPPLSSASAPITSTQQYSPPQYHQPKSGPQTSIVGTPSSPTMSAFSVGGSSVFGNKRQSSYELHNLKPYPSPPGATKQTVHTLPDSLVTPHPYKHHGDAGVISGLAARPESQMYQDAAEPSYGPSPVAVPSWYPGLEYQDGAIHNGVGWVRQAKGPHAVLERGASVAGVPTGVQQEGSATGYHN